MDHHTSDPEQQHDTQQEREPDTVEHAPKPTPRIYVASLADYNEGRLVGRWLDADAEPDELAAGIQDMLSRSPTRHAEEWAIHDYEGFGPLHLNEYEDLATVSQIAQGIASRGAAFAAWAALTDTTDRDELARFDDAYLGHWDSLEAYAAGLLDDLGLQNAIDEAIPDHFQAYVRVDVAGFARDLEYSGEIAVGQGDDGVYLFDQTR